MPYSLFHFMCILLDMERPWRGVEVVGFFSSNPVYTAR